MCVTFDVFICNRMIKRVLTKCEAARRARHRARRARHARHTKNKKKFKNIYIKI